MKRVFLLIIVLTSMISSSAFAHTRSQSFSNWQVEDNTANFLFAVDARRLTQLSAVYPDITSLSEMLNVHISESISVNQSGKPCTMNAPTVLRASGSTYRLSGQFVCPDNIESVKTTVKITAFNAVSPTHIHIARLEDNGQSTDVVLRQGEASFELNMTARASSFTGFVKIGWHHVLSGLDHLVFLVGLALVALRPKQAILCITGFTLGHTAALGLSSYGWISPDMRLVEALIGFTIAVMALEAASIRGLSRQRSMTGLALATVVIFLVPVGASVSPLVLGLVLAVYAIATGLISQQLSIKFLPAITIAFGLIHGAGFASGLQELSLSPTNLFLPLLGFNIGVELAQLLALFIIYAIVFGLRRVSGVQKIKIEQFICLAVFGLGMFWFTQRIWI